MDLLVHMSLWADMHGKFLIAPASQTYECTTVNAHVASIVEATLYVAWLCVEFMQKLKEAICNSISDVIVLTACTPK